jgi:hypothetical protein
MGHRACFKYVPDGPEEGASLYALDPSRRCSSSHDPDTDSKLGVERKGGHRIAASECLVTAYLLGSMRNNSPNLRSIYLAKAEDASPRMPAAGVYSQVY